MGPVSRVDALQDAVIPVWDREVRKLSFRTVLIVEFRRRSAPLLERLLTEFEELRWVEHIEDPLPRSGQRDRKHRLRDTVFKLNCHCLHPLLSFRMDGTGQGVFWEPQATQPES